MPLASFDDLFAAAECIPHPIGVAVAGAADRTVLEAAHSAHQRGWIKPILIGDARAITALAATLDIPLRGCQVLHAEAPAVAAVAQVRAGHAALLMKGQIATPALLHAMLDLHEGLRTGRTMGQIVLMELTSAQRRFLLADTGICIQPTLAQKCDLLQSCVAVAHQLGEEQPNVALLTASETVQSSMPETLEAAEIERRHLAGAWPDCSIRGPLSFDLAYSVEAAEKKRLAHPGLGAADIMLFPNLLSANLTVKAIMYTAPCRFGGVLCGAACPVVFMSRADTTETRLHSLALALRLLQE